MTLQTFCPVCGAALTAGAQFCGNCGTRLTPGRPAAPAVGGPAAGVPGATVVYAGFWIRFVAFIIDSIILTVIQIPISLIIEGTGVLLLMGLLVGIVYDVGFWVANDGATPGKMALGIKVQMTNGDPIDVGPALLRYLGYYVSAFVLLIGYIMIGFTPQKRGLHDYIAGTVVVKTR
jgi:uncharacterized RDD family membrane protein YckC